MEVEGKIKSIGTTQSFGGSNFKKRDIVIITTEQYPQFLSIEFVQDKTELLNPFSNGQSVKIGINLRGREWISPDGEVKYFNSMQGWNINLIKDNAEAPNTPIPDANVADELDF